MQYRLRNFLNREEQSYAKGEMMGNIFAKNTIIKKFLLTEKKFCSIIIITFKPVHAVNEKETDGKLQRAGVW